MQLNPFPTQSAPISALLAASYTMVNGDCFLQFGNHASLTLTLLPAASFPAYVIYVSNETNTNTMAVATQGSDTIDGGSSYTLAANSVCALVSDGVSAWRLLSGVGKF